MMKHHRQIRIVQVAILAAILLAAGPAPAEPPLERTLVSAVADGTLDRILVRWLQVEGTERRFTHYDVMRREAAQTAFTQVNQDPVGAMATVAEIQALFTSPGYEDVQASIQDSFGPDYASSLLLMQSTAAGDTETAQYRLLPDLNYGAAIAFGFGFMDDTVVNGTTYVYEVWGLDELGYRIERLGRATATAGSPDPFEEVVAMDCVDLGDARGHMSATLRWEEPTSKDNRSFGGYDIYRVPIAGDDCATTPNGPGAPGAVKANRFPTIHDSPGKPGLGAQLFVSNCASCHAAPDPRNTPPDSAVSSDNGVKGGTMDGFRRLQYPELAATAHHDTMAINSLSADSLWAIFDWIHQFQFMDDGAATPMDPLVEGATYCYRVLPRDLLGQRVTDGTVMNVPCPVLDRESPDTPSMISSERIAVGDHEICEISWNRNDKPDDDTVNYLLYRLTDAVPRAHSDPAKRVAAPNPGSDTPLIVIPQPGGGERVSHQDATLTFGDAGERFFYAAVARDEAGNTSGFSGWVPCVPRDIVAPPETDLSVECCEEAIPGCEDKALDSNWISAGGVPIIIWDPAVPDGDADCPDGRIRISATHPDDTFGVRLYRSFDDVDYQPGVDFKINPLTEGFEPTIDARIWAKARTYDRSGNLGVESSAVSWIVAKKLPAPMIESIALLPSLPDHVKIKFRTLSPENLLGFALYRYNKAPAEDIPGDLTVYDFVLRHHDSNLSANQANPGEWAVLPGATTLDILLPGGEPTADTYLYHDALDDLYILQAEIPNLDLNGLVFGLVSVGWSGRESDFQPYTIQALTDGVLEWPLMRLANLWGFPDDLAAGWNAGDSSIDLTWTAYPNGCNNNTDRPFIVFRRRGSNPNWEQISPPFVCDGVNTSMLYKDSDVQSGFSYRYLVIRLGLSGEFEAQFGDIEESVP
jgi:mono/diheme cytochrome c family protein